MSAERKKLLWISISACVFVLIILAAGFFLLAPKKGSSQAPATIGNDAPPKAQDPQDFLSAPPPAPALEQPRTQDGGVIIVYGDKPASGAASPSAATATTPATAAPAGNATTSAAPASPEPPKPAAAPSVPPKAAPSATPGSAVAKPTAKKTAAKPAKADEFWIQAASFTSRGRADELKQLLSEKGVAALISVKDIAGKSWYRVRIGPYSVKADADGWLGRLKGIAGCAEAYVSKMTAVAQKAKN